MSQDCFYITTPIYYVNDVPHVGNAYTTVACDVLARFNRQMGKDVVFATGTDENAVKVHEVAKELKMDPYAYVDSMEPKFKQQWAALEIGFDDYIRTTEKRHIELVQSVFKKLMDTGDIYLGSYEGWYCVSDETFFTTAEVTEERCPNPECRRPLQWVKEQNYFFRLSKYQDKLLEYMTGNPGWLRPEFRANEVIAFTRAGLKDQSVSRMNNGWGIPVPGDDSQVIYVWFDALLNYLTVAGFLQDEEKFSRIWPPSVQMMGKDIFVRFHCTLWPAMLMALGVELPEMLVGHGFWTVEGEKISKSKGNAVYAVDLVTEISELSSAQLQISADAIRYYLLREVTFGVDGDFSKQALVNRFNSDLANDLGNLLNRTLSMLHKWFGGEIPPVSKLDANLSALAKEVSSEAKAAMENVQFSRALESIWSLVSAGNKYVEQSAPWVLHREGKETELADVLYNALETARVVTILIQPFMPSAAKAMWSQLGLEGSPESADWETATQFGGLKSGVKTGSADPVFPRIDVSKLKTKQAKPEPKPKETQPVEKADAEIIQYDDFKKLDIRIAKIVAAEKVQGADKLLQLTVDAGEESSRTVVAGIAQDYDPESLVGKSVVLLANLAPAKIRGVQSQGMVLAADVEGKAILLHPDSSRDVPAGSTVR